MSKSLSAKNHKIKDKRDIKIFLRLYSKTHTFAFLSISFSLLSFDITLHFVNGLSRKRENVRQNHTSHQKVMCDTNRLILALLYARHHHKVGGKDNLSIWYRDNSTEKQTPI